MKIIKIVRLRLEGIVNRWRDAKNDHFVEVQGLPGPYIKPTQAEPWESQGSQVLEENEDGRNRVLRLKIQLYAQETA
jgi:hypothetical protein